MVLLCGRWHARVNSLWLWWYCGLIVVGQGYLMYRAVRQCKEYNELPWGTQEKPVAELYVYISLIVVSIMCVPFYTLTAVFKVGNYANDGVRLGRDDLDAGRVAEDDRAGAGGGGAGGGDTRLQTLWKHFVPICNAFHVLAAFTLLLPSVLLDAQKIKHDLLPPGAIWRSELDVILQNEASKMTDLKRTNVYFLRSNLSAQPSPAPPAGMSDNYPAMPISPEFVNYVVALIVYSLRYPAVFWYTKKTFSMIFATQLFVAIFFYMFSFCSMSVLYKYQVNAAVHPNIVLVVPHSALVILYLLTNAFVFFSSVAIFNYGYYHYNESYRRFLQRKCRPRRSVAPPTGCQGYVPHTIATITLVLFIACRAAVVYDAVTIYRKAASRTMLASVVWDVCYMLLWIIMWFVFTIKQSWHFRVRVMLFAETASEIYTIRNHHVRDSAVFANGHVPAESRDAETDAVDDVITSGDAGAGLAHAPVEEEAGGTPPSSPASALRKSGERRVNHARVTFEENAPPDDDPDLSRETPRRRSKDSKGSPSKKRKRKQDHSEKGANKPEANDATHNINSENAEQPKNIFGDFPLQETPENTLTRSYRHSIRDKCGQYYRHSREFQSPPAAQSSPVLGQKQPDLHSQSQPVKEVPFQRRSGEHNLPERPPAPQRPPMGTRHSNPVTKPPPSGAERVLPPTLPPAALAYSKPKQKQPTHSHSVDANLPRKATHVNHPPGMVRNNLGAPTVAAAVLTSGGRVRGTDITPNRDIRIVGATAASPGKPEMGRRDSALPSSNETSSNDSSDNVLCSQV